MMTRPSLPSRVLAAAGIALTAACGPQSTGPPPTVAAVDLDRYLGTWYEIAKIPNRFQKQCTGNTTAVYARRDDGRLEVVNRCVTAGGRTDRARGVARIVDVASNARLEVSFVSLLGWRLFWGDYWILDLEPDYAYSIVGTPDRRYGWVLSRTPTLPAVLRARVDRRLRELGYDPARFEDTSHGS